MFPDKESLRLLVSDLAETLKVLKEQNRYPVFDLLRVVCLSSVGLAEVRGLKDYEQVLFSLSLSLSFL